MGRVSVARYGGESLDIGFGQGADKACGVAETDFVEGLVLNNFVGDDGGNGG